MNEYSYDNLEDAIKMACSYDFDFDFDSWEYLYVHEKNGKYIAGCSNDREDAKDAVWLRVMGLDGIYYEEKV
jgi:hypothetical protein